MKRSLEFRALNASRISYTLFFFRIDFFCHLVFRIIQVGLYFRYAVQYIFCRLCSGRLPLKVSRPLAGHALRELDSSIRSVLAAPMDALPQEDEQQVKRRADALRTLKDMKFDEETLQRADQALKPKLSHRTQIWQRTVDR